jgi:uncharacterized protein YndB with AHSA1/START domain
MNKIILVLAVILAVIGAVGVIGMILPREHSASIRIRLDQPPEQVFTTIADVAAAPSWRPDLQQVEILSAPGGPLRWRETTDWGTLTMTLDESRPPTRLVARIDDPEQPFGGRWIYDLAPTADATVLTITEHGEVYNPFFRFMARFVFGHYRTLENYARDLATHLRSPAQPVRVGVHED